MSAEAKCKCTNCSQPISFPASGVGTTIPCPHCGLDTILFIPPPPSKPETPKNYISDKKTDGNPNIEKNLEGIGKMFFVLGLIELVIGGICFVGEMHPGGDGQSAALALCIAIVSFFQGCIFWVLFSALAEIIRLLRKLVAKP